MARSASSSWGEGCHSGQPRGGRERESHKLEKMEGRAGKERGEEEEGEKRGGGIFVPANFGI